MYKRIWYDRKNNNMHIWYVDSNGKHRRAKIKPNIEYYVEDRSGRSEGNGYVIYDDREQGMKTFLSMKQKNTRPCSFERGIIIELWKDMKEKDIADKIDLSPEEILSTNKGKIYEILF